MSIPDKAVEAGSDAYYKAAGLVLSEATRVEQVGVRGCMRSALEAAEPYLTPALDRTAAIERLLGELQEANRRDVRALASQGWVGIPPVPEDVLRQHCTHLVDALLAPEVKS